MQQTAKSFEAPRTGAIGYDFRSMHLLWEHPETGSGPRAVPAAPPALFVSASPALFVAALPALLLAALLASPVRGEPLAATLVESQRPPAGGAAPARGPQETLAGRPLAEALRALEEDGLTILFTSELVRADMKVLEEPAAREPRQILDEILAPHGLEAREGPGGVLVVARSDAPGAPASIEGRVLVRGRREGLPGVRVLAVGPVDEAGGETDDEIGGKAGAGAETGADGSFSLAGLADGRYTLQATAPGYLDQELDGVRVTAGTPRRVIFELYPRPFHQEEILVRPSRLSLLHEKPDAPFAFSREEIEALPHLGGDVLRSMALLPGTAGNDVTARFSVHGGRRDEVKIVLDGQELYDAFHLEDYDSALSIVPAHSLASASLATGAFPASQGDRMGGVLDLETPEPPAGRHYTLGLSVFDALASSTGSFAGERGRWLVTGRRGSLDLAGDAIGDERPAFWDLLAKTELETRFGRLSAHLLTAADKLEIDRVDGEDFERLENDYRRTYGWLKHQATPGGRLLVETIASWAEIRRDRRSATSEEKGSFELRDRRRLQVLALSQSWSLQLAGRHLLQSAQWGWEARRYDATFDYLKDLRPELVILSPQVPHPSPITRFDGSLRGDHVGIWAADRFTVLERLTAELGLRFDHHDATGDELVSPRINLAWRLGERSVLRAAWGRFFQSQRPYELEVEDGETNLRDAERSDHWVVGYEGVFAPGAPGSPGAGHGPAILGLEAVRIELFNREIDNPRTRSENLLEPLNFFQEIEPDRVRIAAEESSAKGIEVLLRGRPNGRLGWWVAYSLARAEDTLGGETVPRSLDQRHSLTIDLDIRLPRDWHLNLAWRYHSGWPTTPVEERLVTGSPAPDEPEEPAEETELVPAFGPLNSERLPPYHRLDVRASRRWELARGSLTFFVDVQNLYDRENLGGFDVVIDPDEGAVELDEERWPGLFPSLGVTWEW